MFSEGYPLSRGSTVLLSCTVSTTSPRCGNAAAADRDRAARDRCRAPAHRRRGRPVPAGDRPGGRDGAVGGVPVLPEPRRPGHRTARARLRRPRRRHRGGRRRTSGCTRWRRYGRRSSRTGPGRWPTRPSSASPTPRPCRATRRRPSAPSGPGLRVGRHLLGLLTRCHDAGLVDPAVVRARQAASARPTGPSSTAARQALGLGLVPVPLLALGLDALTRLHGFVSLEVFGQLRLTLPDGAGLLRRAARRRASPLRPRPAARPPLAESEPWPATTSLTPANRSSDDSWSFGGPRPVTAPSPRWSWGASQSPGSWP